jgi:lipoate-protein ligase B
MRVRDLGLLEYRAAWKLQEEAHAAVFAGGEEQSLLVEHPPVVTLGRRPGLRKHILVSSHELANRGVEVVESDRGGDITFHGPGQLVAYPIVRLADHHLSVSGYVHLLESIIMKTLSDFGIDAFVDPKAVGVWTEKPGCTSGAPNKIGAIGVRIRRGVTLHGLALNVSTDLSFFNLIIPCGLENRGVTSMAQLLAAPPVMDEVKEKLRQRIIESFTH